MSTLKIGADYDLPTNLTLELKPGNILLEQHRMLMFHIGAFSSLRKEMIDSLGIERVRGLLTRMGYASGKRDAELARRIMPNVSDEELLLVGPKLHSIEGGVNVTPIKVRINIREGVFSGEFLWENSYEAEIHKEIFGLHTEPVCWTLLGYACGYCCEIMDRFILFREVDCTGRGDRHCRIIGKPLEEWKDAEEDMKYFEPELISEQIIQLQKQVEHLRYSVEEEITLTGMIGESDAFRSTCNLLEKVADSDVTVLLLGETGVGKEVFARGLHAISTRAKAPFVAINCAAIPEELLESELFGVEKGAFTGALQSRPGRFERAHGGTLFLDEVGEFSPGAQAKLLRVLQDGEFERVGDTRARKVDVRLIAATNLDLEKAVSENKYRADLFFRLNIYPVVVPPLRSRRSDIPLLTQHFLDKYTAKHGKRIAGISAEALQALNDYEWPGNVRELEHMIERGVIIAGIDEVINTEHLLPRLQIRTQSGSATDTIKEDISRHDDSLMAIVERILDDSTSLDKLEELIMEVAVERSNGNLSSAARSLGLSRPQLAYRLNKDTKKDK